METPTFRTSFIGYNKKNVLYCIDILNMIISGLESGDISKDVAEKKANEVMILYMRTAFNGFDRYDTDKYLAGLMNRITGKEYNDRYRPDYISPVVQFFKDTWKILLAIFIVTSSLIYMLCFDGSEIPFLISFMACIVILTIKALVSWIKMIRMFIILKKSGFSMNKDEIRVTFIIQTGILAFAVWFLANIIIIYLRGFGIIS